MAQIGNVFRTNLKRLLLEYGWTHQDLANEMEVSRPYVTQLLNGARDPGLATLEKVAEIFSVAPDDLIRERETEKRA